MLNGALISQKTILRAALVQVAGSLLAGWWFRNNLNTDATAYLRLAEYYSRGQWDLAVSGYWGPMLSWLMAPLLAAGLPALVAGRLVMGFSALIFLLGCAALLHAIKLPRRQGEAGLWTAALAAIPYSVANITPDLLWAGLLALAVRGLWLVTPAQPYWTALLGGLVFGLAYLTKAVALPLAVMIGLAWAAIFWRGHFPNRQIAGTLLCFFFGVATFALPWMGVLTKHYGRLTLTTSAPINHAIAGPGDLPRYHPTMRTLHAPPPGRVTTWEDPSLMTYADWRPWENRAYAWHQVKLFLKNLGLGQIMLFSIFLDWPCVVGFWLLRRVVTRWRTSTVAPEIRRSAVLSAVIIGSLVLIYAPNFMLLGDQRFFYPAFPFLWLAGVWLTEHCASFFKGFERWCQGALLASFLIPSVVLMFWLLPPKRVAGAMAHQWAGIIRTERLSGPIAGSALQKGGRVGLLTAYLAGQPWLGDAKPLTPAACEQIGARLVFLNQEDADAAAFAENPRWRKIKPPLNGREAGHSAIQVFQRIDL